MSVSVPDTASKPHKGFRLDLKTAGPLLALILLIILGYSLNPLFLGEGNVTNLLTRSAFIGIIAVGATFVITAGGIDLSVGSMAAFIAGMMIIIMNAAVDSMGASIWTVLLGIGCSLILGIGAGFINGFLTTKGKIEAFIVTLGTQGVFYGFALVLTDKVGIPVSNEAFIFLGSLVNRTIPMAFICCLIIYIFAIFIQDRTRLGRYLFAIGGNMEGARLSGINTRFWRWLVYAFAGFLTGLAAVVLVARLEVADPVVGVKWEFEAIAATILGGTSMNIGKGDVKGTIVGVALLTVIRSGLNVVRIPSLWQPAIIGAVIILAIVFQVSVTAKEMKK